jgi:hypothetical protein
MSISIKETIIVLKISRKLYSDDQVANIDTDQEEGVVPAAPV